MREAADLRVISRVGVGVDPSTSKRHPTLGIQVVTTPGANEQVGRRSHDRPDAGGAAPDPRARSRRPQRRLEPHRRRTPHASSQARRSGWSGWVASDGGVAARLPGFDVELLVHDPALPRDASETSVALDELLPRSDVVSIHCPLSRVDAASHRRPRPAVDAARRGARQHRPRRGRRRSGAGRCAPLRAARRRRARRVRHRASRQTRRCWRWPNVVLSPHVGGLSTVSIDEMTRRVTRSVVDVANGGPATDLLNPVRSTIDGGFPYDIAFDQARHRPRHLGCRLRRRPGQPAVATGARRHRGVGRPAPSSSARSATSRRIPRPCERVLRAAT